MKDTGHLITFEGIDGSGKSTIVDEIEGSDINTDRDIIFTREPTHSDIGSLIRNSLSQEDADILTELHLFMADHFQHLKTRIEPALKNGKIVISDRYLDSRIAYQSLKLDGDVPHPQAYIWNLHTQLSRFPDKTVLFEVPPETAAQRTQTNEKYETVDRLKKIASNYRELRDLEPTRFTTVDATQPIEETKQDVVEAINKTISSEMERPSTSD